jgi:hypothetical protein
MVAIVKSRSDIEGATPLGSSTSDICIDSPISSAEISTSMFSGILPAGHFTSIAYLTTLSAPPCLSQGDSSSPMKLTETSTSISDFAVTL